MEASGENRGRDNNRDKVGNDAREGEKKKNKTRKVLLRITGKGKDKQPYKKENHVRAGRELPGTELGKQPSFHSNTISESAFASFTLPTLVSSSSFLA